MNIAKKVVSFSLLVVGLSATAATHYIEVDLERNIEPGREVSVEVGKLYSLTTLPIQVALHSAVTEKLELLRFKSKQAIALAKTTDKDSKFLDGVITVKTFTRRLKDDGAQKFWIFQSSYRKIKKGETTPEAAQPVAYFVAGAYILHQKKPVFPLLSEPHQNLPFLKTFGVTEGEFKLPTPKKNPKP